jgi:hypothetical protein
MAQNRRMGIATSLTYTTIAPSFSPYRFGQIRARMVQNRRMGTATPIDAANHCAEVFAYSSSNPITLSN